jgi:hypothetical protein
MDLDDGEGLQDTEKYVSNTLVAHPDPRRLVG